MTRRGRHGRRVVAAVAAVLLAGTLRAATDPLRRAGDWHVRGGLAAAATCVLHADPADGGPSGGTLRLDGLPPGASVQAAFLYWSVLSSLEPVPSGSPALDGVPVAPERLGEIPMTPCFSSWPRTATFRADVAPLITGNGTFRVEGLPFAADSVTEGATLVVVHCSPGGAPTHVMLWEGVDVTRDGDPRPPPFSQALDGFTVGGSPSRATLLIVAGNGQGVDDGRPLDTDLDPVIVQGVDLDELDRSLLSGALCPGTGRGLYDLTLLDVSALLPAGTASATVEVQAITDCHTIAAVALAVTEDAGGLAGEPSALDLRPGAEPLRVAKAATGDLRLTWEDLGAPFDVSAGEIGAWYSHASLACAVAAPALVTPAGTGDRYFLVAGTACGGLASTVGRDSFGSTRPDPIAPCR